MSLFKRFKRLRGERDETKPCTSQKAISWIDQQLEEIDYQFVKSMVSDCVPEYIYELLRKHQNNKNRVEDVITELVEKKNYPRLKEHQSKLKKEQDLEKRLIMTMDYEDFLKLYPDPYQLFHHDDKDKSDNYKDHCRALLYNNYIMIEKETLDNVLVKYNWHLTPCIHHLESTDYGIKIQNRPVETYPDAVDEHFFREWFYLRNEQDILEYIDNKNKQRTEMLNEARLSNSLKECSCCFNDELLDQDFLSCTLGHKYCKECIKSYIEISIGECKYQFACLKGDCEGEYDTSVVRILLSSNAVAAYERNKLNDEISQANITNLHSCPFCVYAEIIEDPDVRIFYCKNPDCLKESCRECKEPNHLPLRCHEIEKQAEVDMRTWIEMHVTESMIRSCHKCHKRFYKVEGCNMMECPCGAKMCYVCREAITSYSHFNQPNGCKQLVDTNELHSQETRQAYIKAYEEYIKRYPEARSVQMKHDPQALLGISIDLSQLIPTEPSQQPEESNENEDAIITSL